jgi:hypothetical protein
LSVANKAFHHFQFSFPPQPELLQFPDEILEQILRKVPNQLIVGQVNTRFYEISCRVKSFKLQLHPGFRFPISFFTNRKIESVSIERLPLVDENLHGLCDEWRRVLGRIGSRVKEVRLYYTFINAKVCELLLLMPNIEVLFVERVHPFNLQLSPVFRLNLSHLRKLHISHCRIQLVEFSSKKKFFENQRSIKHFRTDWRGLVNFL